MQKDFVTATPDTGSSGTTTVNVTAAANIGEARNTAINVSGSSISKTVQVSQEEGLVRVSLKLMFDFIGANASNYTVQKQEITGKLLPILEEVNCLAVGH